MTSYGGAGRVLAITCGRDGHEHLVADEAFEAGHAGRYVTLCGHDLLAAAMAYPPGPRCWHCLAVREDCTAERPRRWRRGTPRPGMVARLAARLRGRGQTTAGPGRVLPDAPAPPCPTRDTATPAPPPTPQGGQR